jgi:uncharacterized protein
MSQPTCRVLSAGRAAGLLFWAAIVMAYLEGPAAWAAIPSDELLLKLQSQGAISDFAGLLTPAERAAIENRLGQLRQKTGLQFALVTLPSLEGGQIDDFANKLFAKWGVGQKGKNNGVMLLVAVKDRKARVEVGYGLEPILPDALGGRVLDEQLFPSFKQQHYAQGLAQAVNRIAEIIERGEPASPEEKTNRSPSFHYSSLIPVVMVLIFLILMGWGRSRGPGNGLGGFTGGYGGGFGGFGGGSGGGFGGGGFGGGGFSGGGGFGGGCSGGGGASGGW